MESRSFSVQLFSVQKFNSLGVYAQGNRAQKILTLCPSGRLQKPLKRLVDYTILHSSTS
jgi:hypothetical protein